MTRFLALLCCVVVSVFSIACSSVQRPTEQAYIVNSQGAVAPTSRSALAGSTAPGKQELLGIYIPFVGTGLAVKAGLEWDGTPTVIEVPVMSAPQAAPQYVEAQETYMEPQTIMVPKTRTVRRAVVPIPQAAPNPCAPAPQAAPAPRSGCTPPAPVSEAPACSGSDCATVARK